MITETVTSTLARQLEFAELHAWWDQWEAFPDALVRQFRFGKHTLGEVVVLTSPVIPFSHFNRVTGLGLTQPTTEKENEPLADKTPVPTGMRVEKITRATMEDWATFLVTMYRYFGAMGFKKTYFRSNYSY